ncbi:UNVERIFIED_CONTAM: hypothetical protein GTU68_028520 [Idotea baltica]|nr:hypothetical protein [Idotea baltica]
MDLDDIHKLESVVNKGRPVERGAHIYFDNDKFEAVFAVRTGSFKTYRLTDAGTEQVTGFYLPGEIFGMDGMATDNHTESAAALETSSVCSIPFERLADLGCGIPSLRKNIVHLMGKEIEDDRKLIGLICNNTSEQRMATFILSLSQRYSTRGYSSINIRLPMSRGDIASYLGLTPETVSRVLNKLRKLSLIAIDNKELEIRNMEGLKELTFESQET